MEKTVDGTAFVEQDEWNKSLAGYSIADCAIRDKNLIHLVASESASLRRLGELDPSEIPLRSIQICRDEPEPVNRVAHSGYKGFPYPIAGACQKPDPQDLIGGMNGFFYADGSGKHGMERATRSNGNGITPTRIVTIGGYAFATGLGRGVYKRAAVNNWTQFEPTGFPETRTYFADGARGSTEYYSSLGFNDLDGPSERMLYAVGGKGDVWHYDGRLWSQCDFPSNEQLNTVTVAPDGMVYISGEEVISGSAPKTAGD